MWWLYLIAAGGAGTVARFALSTWVTDSIGDEFPWGTLAVNCVGSFLFGLVWVLAHDHGLLDERMRAVVLVGFLGGFTTFSTFAFESGHLLIHERWSQAGLNLLLQNVGAVFALLGGISLGRIFD